MFDSRIPKHLPSWVENSLARDENILARSNQGTILLFRDSGMEFVVKTAMGSGAVRRARQATLTREETAYRRLVGLEGVPRCFGMVADRYLVLEYIRGTPYRDAEWDDRKAWFEQLLAVIRGFHERGVSHGDLKSKSNLMVTSDQKPCVIDFGTTVMHRQGIHPVNNQMFRYLRRLDLNAWVKHKYHGRYEDASSEDRELLNYSKVESILRRYRMWRDGL
jgi:tRNA A-37 threonylcarbamoyl transferase component Bud32